MRIIPAIDTVSRWIAVCLFSLNTIVTASDDASVIVADGGYLFVDPAYSGTVTMAGSGDLFLDSAGVVEEASMLKDYHLGIDMAGGPLSKVFVTFDSNTARTALFRGSLTGRGTLVLESRTRGLSPIFDLTEIGANEFNGTIQTAVARANSASGIQIQAGGGKGADMSGVTIDLSLVAQCGQDPQGAGFDGTKQPLCVILHLAGDLSVKALAGTTGRPSSRVTVANGTTATLTLNNTGNDVFLGTIGGEGIEGGYYEETNGTQSYRSQTASDGSGTINLVKNGSGTQTLSRVRVGRLAVNEGTLIIREGGELYLENAMTVAAGAGLEMQSGATLKIGYDCAFSDWNRADLEGITFADGAVLGFDGTLSLELDTKVIPGRSLVLGAGCLLVTDIPGAVVEGETVDLLTMSGGTLSLEGTLQAETVRYIAGYEDDGTKIYREMSVTGGGLSLAAGNGSEWQGFIKGHDENVITGVFFSADRFDHYVWQGNSSGRPADNRWSTALPEGMSPWEGNLQYRNGERFVTFGMSDLSGHATEHYQVYLEGTLAVAGITVDVDEYANGGMGYMFLSGETAGMISDSSVPAVLEKYGAGMLSICTSNTFSGGTILYEGSILAARAQALGTGKVVMNDGTALYVNYPYESELDSSFRNPVFSNAIQIGNGKEIARVTIGYSPVSLGERLSVYASDTITTGQSLAYMTSRHWRNFHINGGLYGKGDITFAGYTSTTAGGADQWVSFFHVYDREGLANPSDFSGMVKLDNSTLYSEQSSSGSSDIDDRLITRKPGSNQLIISGDVLKGAVVDLTRKHYLNASDVGTAFENAERIVLNNILFIENDAALAGLQGDLIGKTHDSEYYGREYSVTDEVDTMRVVTQNRNRLTLNVASRMTCSYAGKLGTASSYGSTTTGRIGNETTGRETLSLTKAGAGTQYIHTAVIRDLVLREGTLGFNNLDVNGSITLFGGSCLKLGVTEGIAVDGAQQQWGVGSSSVTVDPGRALMITTDSTVGVANGDGTMTLLPATAVVEGRVTISDTSYLWFECNVLPSTSRDNPLLAVLAKDGIDGTGRMDIDGEVVVRFGGYDFSVLGGAPDTYYLATTTNGIYANGVLGGFHTRTISIGGGYFGIVKLSDDARDLVMTVTDKPVRTWYNGELADGGNYVAATDNIWYGSNPEYGKPVSDSDPTLRGTDRYHWQEGLDGNLGENGYYRDSYHAVFGKEGAGKTGAIVDEEGVLYNVVLLQGDVLPASVRVKDDVNYIFRSQGNTNGHIADGNLPDLPEYEGSDDWKTILIKDGSGTLIIETPNSYSGGTTFNEGTIVMRNASALGTGTILMNAETKLVLDFRTGGFIQDIAWLDNKITILDNATVHVTHTDSASGGILSALEGGESASLRLTETNSSVNWSIFNLMDGSNYLGTVEVGSAEDVHGVVEIALTQDTWWGTSFNLDLNGSERSLLHLNTKDLSIAGVRPTASYTLRGVNGADASSRITTSDSALRTSSTLLTLNVNTGNMVYQGDLGFGQYAGLLADDGMRESGYIDVVKKGGFYQAVRNARVSRFDIREGDILVGSSLMITDGLAVSDGSSLIVGTMSNTDIPDYDVVVTQNGTLRLGSQGFGTLTGTSYTDTDGIQKVGNTVLLGSCTLGVVDSDWKTDYEMTLVHDGQNRGLVIDTTGYDPDTMQASGASHVITLNGLFRPYVSSQSESSTYTVRVRNDNAGTNGRVVLGGTCLFTGSIDVTNDAAIELSGKTSLGTEVDVTLTGRDSRLDVSGNTVSYVKSAALSGERASINALHTDDLSDFAVKVATRGTGSSTVTGAYIGTAGERGYLGGSGSSSLARFDGTGILVSRNTDLVDTELIHTTLTVEAGQEAVVRNMLIHAADSGIVLHSQASMTVVRNLGEGIRPGLTISYSDVNFSRIAPDTWATNTLITMADLSANIDFSGGINLLLTDCSSRTVDLLLASDISFIHFVLADLEPSTWALTEDRTGYEVMIDRRLAEAGFAVVNGDTWDRDGKVTLVRAVAIPEPASALLWGIALLALLKRKRS